MINLLHNLLIRYNKLVNLFEWCKWLFAQYFIPRPIGTIVYKKQGKFIITYEVIGHTPSRFAKEMLEEVSREAI
jgi:hypothetical protein